MTGAPHASRQPMTLRAMLSRGHLRLVLFAVVLAGASLTMSGLFLVRGYAVANVALTAQTIGYAVEPAVLFGDRKAVEETISTVAHVGNVTRIQVVDASGATMAEWRKPDQGDLAALEKSMNAFLWRGPETVPVLYSGRMIGSVRVFGSSAPIVRYTLSSLIIALCCLGLTIIATRILARRLEEDVVAPLDHLGDVAHEVRQNRRFERRVALSGIAEVDRLGKDFNALLSELQGWHESMTSENAHLSMRADHDGLTGLGNREKFDRLFEGVLERAKVSAAQPALIYLDSDNFKQINDEKGHDVGDMVICAIAERLGHSVRSRDMVFRLGGDEFAIILDDVSDPAKLDNVVARIRGNMAEPISLGLRSERVVSLSIGTAIFPTDGDDVRQLLRTADRRMYQMKQGAGRNADDVS